MSETRFQVLRRRLVNEAIQQGWRRVRKAGGIAPGTMAADRFGTFGDGSIVGFPTATLYGEKQMHIGEETLIGCWATLAAGYTPEQTTVPPRALVIGDRCVIGLRCGIVAHESIEIDDDVWFGQDVFITDANHGFDDLDIPIGQQLGPHQPVRIGSGSWIGHGAVILPGSQIGRHVIVAAGSVVRGEVPDYSVVGGVPAKVIRTRTRDDDRTRPDAHPELRPRGEYAFSRSKLTGR
ncbi:acyltransferase [Iamia sp. SCSIO 61187]|uniref:acyltransferase n=1 Tax=Iamia sp. SCSIO 61187 TaxID=2722752 RepID=UPI001C63ABE1|nr:acyltransferase [Iamia sp. SCSIO 61187]